MNAIATIKSPGPRFVARPRILAIALALSITGCSLFGMGSEPELPTKSVQTIEYYPRQVKGYQNSYPSRAILILAAQDTRDFLGEPGAADHQPDAGNLAIGVTIDRGGNALQHLYAQPFAAVVQGAIAGSASEAGMSPSASPETGYPLAHPAAVDYVMVDHVKKCWVVKKRGPDGQYGPIWFTSADFAIEVTIYKPPFRTPFWQGVSSATYEDPPISSQVSSPEAETSIYEEPGQVLSVAMTRAVAGIFRRADLHSLIEDDRVLGPH